MKKTALIPTLVLVVLFTACDNKSGSNRYMDVADKAKNNEAAPVPNQTDVTKMLREASLKFRVKSVKDATASLEKMAVRYGGYVAQSMYDIEESENIIRKMTTDSAEEIKKLYQRNHMEIFVLNTRLDTFLDGLNKLVDHLEFRHITAFDVNMEAADENTTAAGSGAYKQSSSGLSFSTTDPNASFVSGTNIKLRKKYARVTMDIYQTPVVKKWVIPNPDSFEVARGGFFDDFGASLRAGWRGTTMFFNYLVSFWPVWLLGSLGWFWWRRKKKGSGIVGIWKKNSAKS